MVPEMAGKPSRDAQDERSAEKNGYKLQDDLKSEGKIELRVELDVMNQATMKIRFYKSRRRRRSQWYKNMITAVLKSMES